MDGLRQIWIPVEFVVPAEFEAPVGFEVWYFVPKSVAHMFAQITEL